jgi:hypothetical protein
MATIFGQIEDAVFSGAAATTTPAATPAAPAPASKQEVEQRLHDIAAKKGVKSNYDTSIVDLMKLLDLDSSLDNRKQLASELGYTGALDGSAEMNIWLHQQVMVSLANRGG